jgi:predicted Zn-dependent protease
VFSSHPRNDQRLQEVVQAAEKQKVGNAERGKGRDEFLRHVNGMVYGNSESQGVLRGNHFYHKQLDMHIAFPEGWRIENLPDRLLASGKDQNDILQITARDRNLRQPPEDFLIGEYKNLEEGLSLKTDAGPGYAGVTKLNTAWGSQPVRVAAVYHGKRIVQFAGAKKDDLPGDEFFDTVNSFRPLRAHEKELAKSRLIKVVRSKRGDTFAKLAKISGLTNYAEAQLRLLNGMYPDGEPTPGQMIKIVE